MAERWGVLGPFFHGMGDEEAKAWGVRQEGGGERTHLLLALVIWPLTMYPFRHGAPFLLLTEKLPTFGRSLRFLATI